jgi:hypothetical protein
MASIKVFTFAHILKKKEYYNGKENLNEMSF